MDSPSLTHIRTLYPPNSLIEPNNLFFKSYFRICALVCLIVSSLQVPQRNFAPVSRLHVSLCSAHPRLLDLSILVVSGEGWAHAL